MGAYLSTPVCDKESLDKESDFIRVGASSMQGWRMTQEDAHSCHIDFDTATNTSLFAVYDGHGGAEVAQYTARRLPDYIKNLAAYRDGRLDAALEDAFIGFDATLLEPGIVKQLRELANGGSTDDLDNVKTDSDVEEEKQEAAMLCEEATMPLDKLLERYGGAGCVGPLLTPPVNQALGSLRSNRVKLHSPVIRAKQKSVTGSTTTEASGAGDPAVLSDICDPVCVRLEPTLVNGHCAGDSADVICERAVDNDVSDVKAVTKSVCDASAVSKDSDVSSTEDSKQTTRDVAVTSTKSASNDAEAKAREVEAGVVGGSVSSQDSLPSDVVGDVTASSSTQSCDGDTSAADNEQPSSSTGQTHKKSDADDVGDEDSEDSEEIDSEDEWKSEDDSEDDDVDGFIIDGEDDSDDDDDDDEDDAEEVDEVMGSGDEPGVDSGCTAVVAVLRGRDLYVANAGDSRCVLCRGGKAVEMSIDHKPEDLLEQTRINKAGGRVTCDGRVNGGLNLSRAIGDHCYKRNSTMSAREQMITALPDVKRITLNKHDQFLVIACDGIWNVLSSQEVVDFVSERMKSGSSKLSSVCEELFDVCLAPDTTGDGTGCDNMTCVIVSLERLTESLPDSETGIVAGVTVAVTEQNEACATLPCHVDVSNHEEDKSTNHVAAEAASAGDVSSSETAVTGSDAGMTRDHVVTAGSVAVAADQANMTPSALVSSGVPGEAASLKRKADCVAAADSECIAGDVKRIRSDFDVNSDIRPDQDCTASDVISD